jgi:hypothetical protein
MSVLPLRRPLYEEEAARVSARRMHEELLSHGYDPNGTNIRSQRVYSSPHRGRPISPALPARLLLPPHPHKESPAHSPQHSRQVLDVSDEAGRLRWMFGFENRRLGITADRSHTHHRRLGTHVPAATKERPKDPEYGGRHAVGEDRLGVGAGDETAPDLRPVHETGEDRKKNRSNRHSHTFRSQREYVWKKQ